MSLRKENAAVIELPFKLVIAAVIMAVTASAGLGALSLYSKGMVENGLRQEAEAVASAAQRLDSMGINSSMKVRISLQNAPLDHVEYFRIGYHLTTPVHPYAAMIRFKGAGSGEGHVYARDAGDNYLPMVSSGDGTLELGSGGHTLLLTKLYSEQFGKVFLRVERTA